MNRSFYRLCIAFTAMSLACGILQNYLFLRLNNTLITQASYFNWMLVHGVITLIGWGLVLKYFHAKQFKIAFKTGSALAILSLLQFVVLYVLLTTRRLQELYIPVTFLLIFCTIVFGISLAFSLSGKRPWLKAAGIFTLVVSTILLFSGIGTLLPGVDDATRAMLQNIVQWSSAANGLTSAFFLVNFLDETKSLRPQPDLPRLPKTTESVLNFAAILSFVLFVFFGMLLTSQTHETLRWQKQNAKYAQEVSHEYEARFVVTATGDTLKYQFMKPANYDPQKDYPLVLCLHHGGTHGNDNISHLGADPAPFLIAHKNQYPAFYLMPQCPKGAGWNSIDASVLSMIKTLEDEFQIDESRRYVLGISGGGYGSWHFISAHPDMFAAAVPICGGGNPELSAKIASIPVWAFHGEDDNLVPVRFSREMIDGMKKAGGNPKYTEFPDAGHNIWNQVSATDGLMDWIFEQKRDSL